MYTYRNDGNTVNVLATACFSPFTKVQKACFCVALIYLMLDIQVVVGALHFFLAVNDSSETTEGDSSGNESDVETSKALRTMAVSKQMTKKGKKRERKMSKALHKIKVSRMLTSTQGSLSSPEREPGTHYLHMHQNPVSSDLYYREMSCVLLCIFFLYIHCTIFIMPSQVIASFCQQSYWMYASYFCRILDKKKTGSTSTCSSADTHLSYMVGKSVEW